MTETEWLSSSDPEPMLSWLGDRASLRRRWLFDAACARFVSHLFSVPLLGLTALEVAEQFIDRSPISHELEAIENGLSALLLYGVGHYPADLRDAATRHTAFYAACQCANWLIRELTLGLLIGTPDFDQVFPPGRRWEVAATALAAEVVAATAPRRATDQLNENAVIVARHLGLTAFHDHFFLQTWQDGRVIFEGIDPEVTPDSGYLALAAYVRARCRQVDAVHDIFGNPFRPVPADPAWLTPTVTALADKMYNTRDFTPMPVLADALQDAGCDDEYLLDHCRASGPHVRGCWVVDRLLAKV